MTVTPTSADDPIAAFKATLVESRILRTALDIVTPEDLHAALRTMPTSGRNRMLSSLGTPSARPTVTTARLLKMNVAKLGPKDHQRFGSFIPVGRIRVLFDTIHDRIADVSDDDLAADPFLAETTVALLDELAVEFPASLVPLGVLASAVESPAMGVVAVNALTIHSPEVFADHAEVAAAAQDCVQETIAAHRHHSTSAPVTGPAGLAEIDLVHRNAADAVSRIALAVEAGEIWADEDLADLLEFRDLVDDLARDHDVPPNLAAVRSAVTAAAAAADVVATLEVLEHLTVPDDLTDPATVVAELAVAYRTAGVVPDADPVFDRLVALAELVAGAGKVEPGRAAELVQDALAGSPPDPRLVIAAVQGSVKGADRSAPPTVPIDTPAPDKHLPADTTVSEAPDPGDNTADGDAAVADDVSDAADATDDVEPRSDDAPVNPFTDDELTTSTAEDDNTIGHEPSATGPAPTDVTVAPDGPIPVTESDTPHTEPPAPEASDETTPPAPAPTPTAPAAAVTNPNPFPTTVAETTNATSADEDTVDDDAVTAALLACVSDGRFGLGHHVARLAERDHWADTLKVAAYAHAVRSSTSPSASEMVNAAHLSGVVDDDIGSLALRTASAIRVALLAPTVGATATIAAYEHLLRQHLPALASIVEVVRNAETVGLVVRATGEESGVDAIHERLDALREEARDQLDAERRNVLYRGWGIWNEWIEPTGRLGILLHAVRDDDVRQLQAVRQEAAALTSDQEITAMIREADKAHRGKDAEEITGNAAKQLRRGIKEVVAIAVGWVDARAELSEQNGDTRSSVVAELHTQRANDTFDNLDATFPGDSWRDVAVRAAVQSLRDTGELLGGEPLDGADLDPDQALNRGLLLDPAVAIDPDTLALLDPDSVTLAGAVKAATASRADGVAARMTARDFGAAEAICTFVTGPADDDFNVAQFLNQVFEQENRHHKATYARWERIDRRVDADVAHGRVVGARESELRAALLNSQPGDTPRTGRRDLGRIDVELDRIEATADAVAADRVAEVRSRIAEAAAQEPSRDRVASRTGKLYELVDAGEVAAAEEFLARLTANADTDVPDFDIDEPSQFAAALTAVAQDPDGVAVNVSFVEAARVGETVGPFDFTALDENRRTQVAAALKQWIDLRDKQTRPAEDEWERVLRTLLPVLGLTVDGALVDSNVPPTPDRAWLIAKAEKTGFAFVPVFGSRSDGRWRILVCWDQPTAEAAHAAATRDTDERPVLVLYMGSLSAGDRVDLIGAARSSRAGRVMVVDDYLFAWAAATAAGSMTEVAKAALPASGANPYNPEIEQVAEEMFYGRVRELQSVLSMQGTNFISGGRRFGKSALLNAARDRILRDQRNAGSARAVVVANLRDTPTASGTPDDVWAVIGRALQQNKIVPAALHHADEVIDAVLGWLADDENRSLLLLLDECDEFLRQDAGHRFSNVIKLRDGLWAPSDHRFKVVFAGLQHVNRFRNQPNQPVSQLVDPITVGPLDAESAGKLLARPLAALGFKLAPEQVAQIVAWSWCNASLLQHTAKELVDQLHDVHPTGLWPWPVPETVVTNLLTSPALESEWKKRLLSLTLELDHRYKLTAHLLAADFHQRNVAEAVEASLLWRRARDIWPAGFGTTTIDEFRALCDEMVGMRILSEPVDGRYQLFSPQVRRAFGDEETVTALLDNADEVLDPPAEISALHARYAPDGGHDRVGPVSIGQLNHTIASGTTSLRIVFGTPALGVDLAASRIVTYASQAVWRNQRVVDPATVSSKGDWRRAMTPPEDRDQHAVVVTDHFVDPDASHDAWHETIDLAMTVGTRTRNKGTRTAVVVAHPTMERVRYIDANDHIDRLVTTQRLTKQAIQASVRDERFELSLLPDFVDRVMAVTGGWPVLLDRVIGTDDPTVALDELEAELTTGDGAAAFVAATGLGDTATPVARELFAAIVDFDEPGTRTDLLDILAGSVDATDEDLATAWEVLEWFDVLTHNGGVYRPEPVVAAAWRNATSSH